MENVLVIVHLFLALGLIGLIAHDRRKSRV